MTSAWPRSRLPRYRTVHHVSTCYLCNVHVRYAVKRRIRECLAAVEGFQLQDFQLRDVVTGRLFGVRGDTILPPNSLHEIVLNDFLPLTRGVRTWRDGLSRRNEEWRHTMETLVDGTTFVQVCSMPSLFHCLPRTSASA